jgi:arylsulfatase A-like enzyme
MKDGVNFEPCYDSKTYAEHGGFGKNETHVPLLITNVNWKSSIVHQPVLTKQIAPTILSLLNLDPQALMGVQIEKTTILPGIPITFE